MPLSLEQFYNLDEQITEKLPIYGDLLKLYNIQISAPLKEAGRLYRELILLDDRLLTTYVSFILSKVGFYVKMFSEGDGDFPPIYTTSFTEEDWAENIEGIPPYEGDVGAEWQLDYENKEGEGINIIFVRLLFTKIDFQTGKEINEAKALMEKFENSTKNYVVVHPWIERKAKETFGKTKKRMVELTKEDLVLSVEQLTHLFIPNKEKKHIMLANWETVREKIIKKLQKNFPILVYAINRELLENIREQIGQSELKLKELRFEDAIKDAGVSCEGLLNILFSLYKFKKPEEGETFHDLLCKLQIEITHDFGENIHSDLNFIREWRNNVLHPKKPKPDEAIAIQVVDKNLLFYKLFEKKLLKRIVR